MTTHSMTCTHCGHRIQSDSLEELVATKRNCPLCGSSSWELVEFDSFPCSLRERRFMYQKLLHIGKWCMTEKACETGAYCPLVQHCKDGDWQNAFFKWLMEGEI